MKFGIAPLEGDNFKNIFNKKKGLNSFLDFRFSDIILDVIQKGYKHCEITLDLFQVLPIQLNDDEKHRIKSFKKKYDITYSAHFPLWSIELSSPNKFIREGSIQSLINSYNMFKFLEPDIDVFVLHPTGAFTVEVLNFFTQQKYKQFILDLLAKYAIESIEKIIKETKIDKTKIAIENIEFPFEKTLDIIKKLKGPKLCIDTAHFLGGYSGDIDLVDITEKYLNITSEIHLQDFNAGEGADHAALGTGKNFPVKFLQIIHKYDFKGPIIFELPFKKAFESVQFIKKHAPEIELPNINNH